MSCDFMRALGVVIQSVPLHDHLSTRDIACMLQALHRMFFLAVVHANTSFKTLFAILHLFSNTPLCTYVVMW